MLYIIIAQDTPNSLILRKQSRPEHLKRLEALKDQGRLIIAGPNPAIASPDPGDKGFTGSIIIAEFQSLEAAKAWADSDPYIKAGVYESVSIKPFIQALP
jgi:uncharacterized protein